jgi:hypothetical protein
VVIQVLARLVLLQDLPKLRYRRHLLSLSCSVDDN